MKLNVMKCHPDAVIPKYETAGAGCFDIVSISEGGVGLSNGAMVFRTGLKFEVPEGWTMLVFSRSGHGFKSDVRLSNCVGVIDSDYRGELLVKLRSDAPASFAVLKGDRIAQAMLISTPKVELEEVSELSETKRGAKGFGSTDRKFFGQIIEGENNDRNS